MKTIIQQDLPKIDINSDFIKNNFSIIFICENKDKLFLLDSIFNEYRANTALKIGEDIKIIATDLNENKEILVDYLKKNNVDNVDVILFSELEESKKLDRRPPNDSNNLSIKNAGITGT